MDFTPLRRHRDYRWLFAAQFISFLGTMVTYVALPYQMYKLTGSSLAVGLLGLAELLPLLVTAFLGGALADAVDRRRMVLVTELGLGLGSGLLAFTALSGHPPVWTLYTIAALMSALNGLQRPSLEALTPRLVDREEIPAAAGLTAFRGSVGMIAGPALGGALIASAGLTTTYLFDLLTYIFSLLAVSRIRAMLPPESAEKPSLESVLEGFRYTRTRQELIGTYVVDIVAMVFGMPLALFPALSQSFGGPKTLGLLYAAPACGALVASLTSRWTSRVHRHGLAVMLAATVWGLAIVAFGFSSRFAPAVVFLALAGGADAVSGMFRMTLWNQTIPDSLRGRMAGIEMVSYTSGPLLGHVEAGLVAAAFSVRTSVISGGVLCVVGVLLCGLLLPRFVAYDARRP
ncbi:MAG TPA: MFS transporter [Thermoanaerobaculia bacterium]|jgi:MFS family permease|nr:MFS transporter [Thermoanaerobaculia bacterium]